MGCSMEQRENRTVQEGISVVRGPEKPQVSDEEESADQDPGYLQKLNQNEEKDDPLAA